MRNLFKLLIIVPFLFGTMSGLADTAPRVLIVVTSNSQLGDSEEKTGFWLTELTHPYYSFKKAGYSIDIASPEGGMAPISPTSFTFDEGDPYNERFLKDADFMSKVIRTIPINSINPQNYDVVFFSGGSGTMWDFPDNKDILEITRTIYENKGIVAAVCHGPAALVNVKLSNGDYLVSGKNVTAFTNEEEDILKRREILPFLLEDILPERGANYEQVKAWGENVVVDGRLITGQNPASAMKVAEEVINYFENR